MTGRYKTQSSYVNCLFEKFTKIDSFFLHHRCLIENISFLRREKPSILQKFLVRFVYACSKLTTTFCATVRDLDLVAYFQILRSFMKTRMYTSSRKFVTLPSASVWSIRSCRAGLKFLPRGILRRINKYTSKSSSYWDKRKEKISA